MFCKPELLGRDIVGRPPLFARLSKVILSGTLDIALCPFEVIALTLETTLSDASVVAVAWATKF